MAYMTMGDLGKLVLKGSRKTPAATQQAPAGAFEFFPFQKDIDPLLQSSFTTGHIQLPEFRSAEGELEARFVTPEEVLQAISPSFTSSQITLPEYYSGPLPFSYYGAAASHPPGQFQFMQTLGLPQASAAGFASPYAYGGYGSAYGNPFGFYGMGSLVPGSGIMAAPPQSLIRTDQTAARDQDLLSESMSVLDTAEQARHKALLNAERSKNRQLQNLLVGAAAVGFGLFVLGRFMRPAVDRARTVGAF